MSYQLTVDLYRLLHNNNDFELRNQVLRSAISIPSNIAEGYERKSNKEYVQFLYISKGSCAELRTQLMLLKEVTNLDTTKIEEFIDITRKISAMLHKLIQTRIKNF